MPAARRERNLTQALVRVWPPAAIDRIGRIGAQAARLGFRAYLVGGCVRDLILRRAGLDIDIGIEGDAPCVGERVRDRLGAELKPATVFGTTALRFPDGMRIDLATARRETYPRPAALPAVEISDMNDDLARRDFTINTLAVMIDPADFGRLVDLFGGAADLKKGLVRVLHERSFVDDPTRILRAARFAGRFSFRLEERTEALAREAIRSGGPASLSGKRLFTELNLILKENDPIPALRAAARLDALSEYHPGLLAGRGAFKILARVEDSLVRLKKEAPAVKAGRAGARLFALLSGLDDTEAAKFFLRVSITGGRAETFLNERRRLEELREILPDAGRNSEIFRACDGLSVESLLYLRATAAHRSDRRKIERHLSSLRHLRPSVTGKDLLRLGYSPGPGLGEALRAIRDAVLDGRAHTRDEQLAIARERLSGEW